MLPAEREDKRYLEGVVDRFEMDEKTAFSMFPDGQRLRVLDVGCGPGSVTKQIAEMGHVVTGLDFSVVAVELGKKKGLDVRLCDLDKEGIPFKGKTFDVVYAADVVEHVFDPLNLFREFMRVLKDHGKLILSTPNNMHLMMRLRVFLLGVSPQTYIYRTHRQCKHHTVMSYELLSYMVREEGMRIERFRSVARIPKTRKRFVTRIGWLSRYLPGTFIVRCTKA